MSTVRRCGASRRIASNSSCIAGTAADHAVELELLGDVGVDAQKRFAPLDALADGDEHIAQPLDVERLGQVVERAVP